MSTNLRAQPDVELDLEQTATRFPPSESGKISAQIVRMPKWLRDMIKEAADTEGLSQNAWISRVLAEHAKLSVTGWRSIPLNDRPRESFPYKQGGPEPDETPPWQKFIQPPVPLTNPGPPNPPGTWPGGGTQPWFVQPGTITTSGTGTTGTWTNQTLVNGLNSNKVSVTMEDSDGKTVDLTGLVSGVEYTSEPIETTKIGGPQTFISGPGRIQLELHTSDPGVPEWPAEDIPDLS